MKKRLFILQYAFICMFMLSCEKGDTGPQGPAGPQGPQGPLGVQGNPGSANVIYSDWISVGASEWKDTVMTNFTRCQRVLKTATALTQPIMDSGVILVYLRDLANNTYALPLPYNVNPLRFHNFIPMVGKFLFFEYATDGSGGVTSVTNRYRYILIPGKVKTTGRMHDWKNMQYADVCKTLKIPE